MARVQARGFGMSEWVSSSFALQLGNLYLHLPHPHILRPQLPPGGQLDWREKLVPSNLILNVGLFPKEIPLWG